MTSEPARKKLVAIDGNSLLYRAFFAMRYLSTTSGQPTNALYGLTTMILKVLEDKPDYIVAAFDTPQPTFRHEEYKDYKAQRKPTPEDLIAQAQIARDLLRAFGIPVVEVPGYEADDIIGALAKAAEQQGIETTILTGDLDTLQLVDDYISVMTTLKGVSETVTYDAESVGERFGLSPEQMPDFKGLKGDASDNIPGVPGIGDKTAAELLQRFGTLENLLDHLDELPEGKVKRALKENKELAKLSKHLATIVTNVPVETDLERYRMSEPDYSALRDLFVRLEFKTMLQRLPDVSQAPSKDASEEKVVLGAWRRIESSEELRRLIDELKKAGEYAVHCHTSGAKPIGGALIGIGFCSRAGESAYVSLADRHAIQREPSLGLGFDGGFQADPSDLKDLLSSDQTTKFCHDYKRNYAALALRGVELKGVVFDAILAAYVLDPARSDYEVGTVGFEQLGVELPGVTCKSNDGEACDGQRICSEAEVIYRLKPVMESKLKSGELWNLLVEVEVPLAPVLAKMELAGVCVDVQQLESLSKRLESEIAEVEQSIYEKAGEKFNIGSPKQLQTVLFDKLGLTASRKTKTGFSTSASALEEMSVDHPIVADILRYRELTKIKSTYADALPKLINPMTGRIHTSLNQAVTATGRLSSSDPNLQNIPIKTDLGREIRRAFVASGENVLLSADYSQIELRILAHFTGDENLVSAFEADEDIHLTTACIIFNCKPDDVTPEMRRRAKTVNFAVLYGMADFTLSRNLGISVHEARDYIDTYFARFPGVKAYTEEIVKKARECGYVTTLLGRRRYIPDINSSNRNLRMFAERAAINTPIQGTAADLMKIAMIRVDRRLVGSNTKMLLQVHDELLFELPPGDVDSVAALVRKEMGGAHPMRVPLKVDVTVGKNWAEMKNVI